MRKHSRKSRGRGTVSHKKVDIKPISERAKKVGGEKFGILAIDPHKPSCTCRVTNFFGEVLMSETNFDKTAEGLKSLVETVTLIMTTNGLLDLAVALEASGTYYRTIKSALAKHWTVRLVHPFTTKQLRQPANSGNKTDETDLEAMGRAMISGYSYEEADIPPFYEEWRLFARNRRIYVDERTQIMQRCMEKIEANMPGITTVFKDFWKQKGVVAIIRFMGGARQVLDAGESGIRELLKNQKIKMATPTIHKLLEWARNASEPERNPKTRGRLIRDDIELIERHTRKISEYDFELLRFLVQNPALVLLSLQGLNVVSVSGYACELGPVTNYINSKKITGAAGIYPSRSQSGEKDRADGPVVKGHNARLRGALMTVSYCLRKHNPFLQGWSAAKKAAKGNSSERMDIPIACKFARISFNMLVGHQVFRHPQGGKGEPILPKLIDFCKENKVDINKVEGFLKTAVDNLPEAAWLPEAQALEETIKSKSTRGRTLYYDYHERKKSVDYLWGKINQKMERSEHGIIGK